MQIRTPLKIISAAAVGAGLATYAKYRREMKQRIEAVETGGTVAHTAAGPIEYAEAGDGQPLLIQRP